jgi:hypothetical protein
MLVCDQDRRGGLQGADPRRPGPPLQPDEGEGPLEHLATPPGHGREPHGHEHQEGAGHGVEEVVIGGGEADEGRRRRIQPDQMAPARTGGRPERQSAPHRPPDVEARHGGVLVDEPGDPVGVGHAQDVIPDQRVGQGARREAGRRRRPGHEHDERHGGCHEEGGP